MKRSVVLLLLFFIGFTSCKSHKNLINTAAIAKKATAKKIARKHVAANFNKKNIEAKFKATYKDAKNQLRFSVQMKLIKDKVIWLKGTKFVTLFKAKITPTSVSYYSPIKKNYFEGDFSMLKKILGVAINFEQLQNLLLGQAVNNPKKEKQEIVIENNLYVLSPKNQQALFKLFFYVNPTHYKLEKQVVLGTSKTEQLTVLYPKYSIKNKIIFPDKIIVKAQKGNKHTQIDLNTKSVFFDKKPSIIFKIPSTYKPIKL